MSDLSTLKFFTTQAHPCSYLPERDATTLFLDPAVLPDKNLYSRLSCLGFRRSGDYLYRPHCAACQACLPARVRTSEFRPNRRFRRLLARHQSLDISLEPPRLTTELYRLYCHYIEERHRDGDMYPPSQEQFSQFLLSRWANSRFVCFRRNQELIAVAVTDQLEDGLSAVYSFFVPELAPLSLGTYAILWQIRECQRRRLPYLYLGYLIHDCRKMAYKQQFGPLEVLASNGWQLHQPPASS